MQRHTLHHKTPICRQKSVKFGPVKIGKEFHTRGEVKLKVRLHPLIDLDHQMEMSTYELRWKNEREHTWPDAAIASVRRDTANQTCIHIWWAAIATGPWRAAIDVPNVKVVRTARVVPRRKPPVSSQSWKQKQLGKELWKGRQERIISRFN